MKHSKTQTISRITLCVMLTGMLALPVASHAASFNKPAVNTKVTKIKKPVTNNVKKAANQLEDKVHEISLTLNDIYNDINIDSSLRDQLENGPLLDIMQASFEFMKDEQAEYQRFLPYAESFRADIRNIFMSLIAITEANPGLSLKGGAVDRIEKTVVLIDKMPTQFLYIMHKAMGSQLDEMMNLIGILREKVEALPVLPTPFQLMTDAQSYKPQLCVLVQDEQTAAHVASIQAIINTLIWIADSVGALSPSDLSVTVNVAAGGGTTVSKHPASIGNDVIASVILGGISLKIDNMMTYANSLCYIRDSISSRVK